MILAKYHGKKKKKNKGGSCWKMKCMSIKGANASFSKMPCLSHEEIFHVIMHDANTLRNIYQCFMCRVMHEGLSILEMMAL
jgi:hypothetical protein